MGSVLIIQLGDEQFSTRIIHQHNELELYTYISQIKNTKINVTTSLMHTKQSNQSQKLNIWGHLHNLLHHRGERRRRHGAWIGLQKGLSFLTGAHHVRIHRKLAQIRHIEALRHALRRVRQATVCVVRAVVHARGRGGERGRRVGVHGVRVGQLEQRRLHRQIHQFRTRREDSVLYELAKKERKKEHIYGWLFRKMRLRRMLQTRESIIW